MHRLTIALSPPSCFTSTASLSLNSLPSRRRHPSSCTFHGWYCLVVSCLVSTTTAAKQLPPVRPSTCRVASVSSLLPFSKHPSGPAGKSRRGSYAWRPAVTSDTRALSTSPPCRPLPSPSMLPVGSARSSSCLIHVRALGALSAAGRSFPLPPTHIKVPTYIPLAR